MPKNLFKIAKQKKIKYFLISFVDLFGVLRSKLVPVHAIKEMQITGAGSSEGLLVILAVIIWIGWHVLTAKSESDELERLARKRHGPNDHKSNITDW